MLARWGVLHGTTEVLNNRYSGAVFVRLGKAGHVFNQHYLSVMFPLAARSWEAGGDGGFGKLNGMASMFLDELVDVYEALAMKREDTAVGVLCREAGDARVKGIKKGGADREMPVEDGMRREVGARSVRELTRLWLYLGGRSPKDWAALEVESGKGSGKEGVFG